MVTEGTLFDTFFAWLQAVDPSLLPNEAEVESKFVVPLFQHLGYPEQCRRPQYPLDTYEPGKRKPGRKPTIDQIYFSTTEQSRQTSDTSLLIVEAKEPSETHLDEALKQAHFYGYYLTPLFLVITNARRLVVVKRHGFRGEERVFDITLTQLQKQETAKQFYQQLRFDVVKRLKEQLADELTHTLYVDLMQTLQNRPDLREQLAKGDFERSRTEDGRRRTVIEPKVAIVCDFPTALGDGACRIQFSNVLLRGLTCHLTHRQILDALLTGLGTPPDWGTRRFITKTEDGSFEANLGQTTVILSEQEARELCNCIDDIGSKYKEILVLTEEMLQTWEYLPVSLAKFQMQGFHLLTVEPWLWRLILRFTSKFDFLAGNSSWHIFDTRNDHFSVLHHRQEIEKEYNEHVLIYPYYGSSEFPQRTVDLLYCVEDWYLDALEREDHLSWEQMIGPRGRWTAPYTEDWLVNKLIPQVLAHYPFQSNPLLHPKSIRRLSYWTLHSLSERNIPLAQISKPIYLAPYLHQIQGWFHIYGAYQIAASLLQPYYTTLTDVVRHIDPSSLGSQYFQYIHGYVIGALQQAREVPSFIVEVEEHSTSPKGADDLFQEEEDISATQMIREIIGGLDKHVRRIHSVDHEPARVADFVSCALIALLEHGTIQCGQEHLNAAREAIIPLLDLSRFEERYILRSPWE